MNPRESTTSRFREEGFEAIRRQRRHIRGCLVRRQRRRDAEYRAYRSQIVERMKWIRRFRDRSVAIDAATPTPLPQGILSGFLLSPVVM